MIGSFHIEWATDIWSEMLLFMFWDFGTLVKQSNNWQLYRKVEYFWAHTYLGRFYIRALFVLFTVTLNIYFGLEFKLNRNMFLLYFTSFELH